MELRHLRYFIAVAEELNFTRAAERVQIAQSPLSQQIRQLEQELEVQLFERTKQQVRLTPAGELFLEEARQTLDRVEQAVRTVKRAGQGEIGRLVIGFASSAAHTVLPEILHVFRERFPDVDLVLKEVNTGLQVQQLQEGRIDTGFCYMVPNDEALSFLPILQEPLVVALPQSHRLVAQPQVPIRVLCDEPFILFPRHLGPQHYDQIISVCQQSGFSPIVAQEANQMQTIIGLVAGGMGVALVPSSLQNLQRVGVVYRTIEESTPNVETVIMWRRDDPSAVLHQFIKLAKDYFCQ